MNSTSKGPSRGLFFLVRSSRPLFSLHGEEEPPQWVLDKLSSAKCFVFAQAGPHWQIVCQLLKKQVDCLQTFWSLFANFQHLWEINMRAFAAGTTKRKSTIYKISKCGGLFKEVWWSTRRCGGRGVVSLPLGRPARVRISSRGLPTVWSEGRQVTL